MTKAEEKSVEWQLANNPMAIGGDAFADMIAEYNVNPAFVAGYKQAEKETIERAVKWLDENIYKYEVEPMGEYDRLALLDDLKEAMEKEEQ